MKPPAPNPCPSCPYRRDVPSGIWDAEEYRKLPRYDAPTQEQPPGVFQCHLTPASPRVCAGWAGCHDGRELLALRLRGVRDPDLAQAVTDYQTEVPLFASGAEAARHGLREITAPSPAAVKFIEKIKPS